MLFPLQNNPNKFHNGACSGLRQCGETTGFPKAIYWSRHSMEIYTSKVIGPWPGSKKSGKAYPYFPLISTSMGSELLHWPWTCSTLWFWPDQFKCPCYDFLRFKFTPRDSKWTQEKQATKVLMKSSPLG